MAGWPVTLGQGFRYDPVNPFTEAVSQKLHVYIIFSDFIIVSWVLLSIHGNLYARDAGLIPGSRRSPGEGRGNPLQCSCLENPMDRGAWWATAHGIAKSRTRLTN